MPFLVCKQGKHKRQPDLPRETRQRHTKIVRGAMGIGRESQERNTDKLPWCTKRRPGYGRSTTAARTLTDAGTFRQVDAGVSDVGRNQGSNRRPVERVVSVHVLSHAAPPLTSLDIGGQRRFEGPIRQLSRMGAHRTIMRTPS